MAAATEKGIGAQLTKADDAGEVAEIASGTDTWSEEGHDVHHATNAKWSLLRAASKW